MPEEAVGSRSEHVSRLWANPTTFATSLLALAIDDFGTECFEWEPQTIRSEIVTHYKVTVPQVNMDKLLAMITVMNTDLFYTSVETFTHVANALNGDTVDFRMWDPPDPAEAAWAITEVTLSDLPRKGQKFEGRFSTDVKRYLGVILVDAGIKNPPDVLRIAEMDIVAKEVDETFADEPSLFEGFHKMNQEKNKDIVDYVKSMTAALIGQLDSLPLNNRDKKSWEAFVERARHSKGLSGITSDRA